MPEATAFGDAVSAVDDGVTYLYGRMFCKIKLGGVPDCGEDCCAVPGDGVSCHSGMMSWAASGKSYVCWS